MKCTKCNQDFSDAQYKQGETYKGIDYHHNPPTFMMEKWEGMIIPLCREHHVEIHREIKKIMFKHSSLMKPKNSEHWTWIAILPKDRKKVIRGVNKFAGKWLDD